MRKRYIYEQSDWPHFRWQQEELAGLLEEVLGAKRRLLAQVDLLGMERRREAVLDTITGDVLKSSEIEGEFLDPDQVRSSVARGLDLPYVGLVRADRDVEGVVEMLLDATLRYKKQLTQERLFKWHSNLFPNGWSDGRRISVGVWRNAPMRVVSRKRIGGPEKLHFEAPVAERVEQEMQDFLDWFNSPPDIDPVLKAGLAHLWFVTIHPFDDGNGRIARAIADMALARSDRSEQRFYSMSSQIREERKDYYDILERTQRGETEITPWMCWFVACLGRAIDRSRKSINLVLRKARFWERVSCFPLNERHRKVLNRLLDDGENTLTSRKWAKIGGCTRDYALQDISSLEQWGIIAPLPGEYKNTRYEIVDIDLGRQLSLLDLAGT